MIRRRCLSVHACLFAASLVVAATSVPARGAAPAQPLAFAIRREAKVAEGPLDARVYVFLGGVGAAPRDPRFGPDWFATQPFFATDAHGWKAGEPLVVDATAAGYPGPLSELPAGEYKIQAVVRLNPDTHALGDGAGNAFGPVVTARLDPKAGGTIELKVDQIVPPHTIAETDHIKVVEFESALLSRFYGRPVQQRAAVLLPKGDLSKKRPVLYIIPGFGGDARMVAALDNPRLAFGRDFVRVVLDPDCFTGHHVFADSATNGPRGRALVEEMIPLVEARFPVIPGPRARLVNGHSSGGWSSLWLQTTYPDAFAGVWSTSPDPVDFRDFQRINLYAPGENMFKDRDGNRRPVARRGLVPFLWYDDFSRMEEVIGAGGQLRSFEAVFSPLDEHGNPRRLWDRKTGAVDLDTAKSWEKYDIRLQLEHNWKSVGPKLQGKLHVYTGSIDTFYLEGAVDLLKKSLAQLGSDALVEVFPGKDHSSLLDAELAARIDREMHAAVRDLYAADAAAPKP
ncbi:MAG: alpha/beta hydrolase [Planctomycetota bacterium]|nr:alpha/beta hydrolase [Planctomycetota bacterium]